MNKTIIRHERATGNHMVGDGFRVAQMMPGYGRAMSNETSPFLMLDYNAPWQVPPQGNHRPGVGYHPHRGFETVTIAYAGEIEHNDTAGNGGVIRADEVQWMTAGSGLLHNEFMTSNFSRAGGVQHMVQLWVNLPAEHKMTEPRYQALTKENIPEVAFDGGRVRVIAGEFVPAIATTESGSQDAKTTSTNPPPSPIKGPAKTFSPVELYDVRFDRAGTLTVSVPDGYNLMMIVTEGSITVADKLIGNSEMVYFSLSGSTVTLSATDIAKVLIMAGEPLNEPVVNYGPFVMNSQEEIMQAFKDLNAGKMGVAPDEMWD